MIIIDEYSLLIDADPRQMECTARDLFKGSLGDIIPFSSSIVPQIITSTSLFDSSI